MEESRAAGPASALFGLRVEAVSANQVLQDAPRSEYSNEERRLVFYNVAFEPLTVIVHVRGERDDKNLEVTKLRHIHISGFR